MRQILLPLRSHLSTLLLTLLLALGAAYYVLAYLPQRGAYLRARYFRVLRRVGDNLHDKAYASAKRSEAMMREIRYTQDSCAHAARPALPALPALPTHSRGATPGRARWQALWRNVDTLLRARWQRQGLNSPHFVRTVALPDSVTDPTPAAMRWDSVSQRLRIDCEYAAPPRPPLRVESWTTMPEFVGDLLRPDVFEHFIILGPDGDAEAHEKREPLLFDQVYYSSFAAPTALALDGPGVPRWWRDTTGIQAARQVELTIGGQPYRLFVQPVRLTGRVTWLLCGAVAAQRFAAEQQALPSGWLELALTLILGCLMALPFLKVLLMGPRERLGSADVRWCGAALGIGLPILTLVLLTPLVKYGVEVPLHEWQLRQLAGQVDTLLSRELAGIDRALKNTAPQLRAAMEGPRPGAAGAHSRQLHPPGWVENYQPAFTRLVPAELVPPPAGRPWQNDDRLLWLDSAGNLVAKIASERSRFLPNLRERPYFQQAQDPDRRWALAGPAAGGAPSRRRPGRSPGPGAGAGPGGGGGPDITHLVLASVLTFSRKGNKIPLVAQACADTLPLDLSPARQPVVRSYATALRSLSAPVLPPGYSFCLIDARGEVQFHSDDRLSLSENLLDDCEPPGLLRAALLARAQPADGVMQYQGRTYRFYLHPLHAWPLFVVAMADQGALQARQMQTLGLAALLVLGLGLGLGLLTGAGALVLRGVVLLSRPPHRPLLTYTQPFAHFWPCRAQEGQYWLLLVLQGVLLVTLLLAAPRVPPLARLGLLAVLPLYGLGFASYALRPAHDNQRGPKLWQRQVVLGALLLGLNAVVGYYWLGWSDYRDSLLPWQLAPAALLTVQWTTPRWQRTRAWRRVRVAAGRWRGRWEREGQGAKPGPRPASAGARVRFQFPFTAWLLSWVLLLGVGPAVGCYFLAYRAERELQLRFAHVYLEQSLRTNAQQLAAAHNPGQCPSSDGALTAFNQPFARGYYPTFFATHEAPGAGAWPRVSTAEQNFRRLITRLHPGADSPDTLTQRAGLVGYDDSDTTWHVQTGADAPLVMRTTFSDEGRQVRTLESWVPTWCWGQRNAPPGRARPAGFSRAATTPFGAAGPSGPAWGALLLALGGLYALLLATVRQVFGLHLMPPKQVFGFPLLPLPAGVSKYQLLLRPTWKSTFQPGTYPPGTRRLLRTGHFLRLDCRELDGGPPGAPLPEKWQQGLKDIGPGHTVVLEYFEYRAQYPAITQQKIAALRELLRQNKLLRRVIILSRIPPDGFGDCGHSPDLCPDKDQHAAIWQLGDELAAVLGRFELLYRPGRARAPLLHARPWALPPAGPGRPSLAAVRARYLRKRLQQRWQQEQQVFELAPAPAPAPGAAAHPAKPTPEQPRVAQRQQYYEALRWFIKVECHALPFLARLEPGLAGQLRDAFRQGGWPTEDTLVLRIQQRAQLQFRELWQMLSPAERYLLYDLARDGLVNSGNAILIGELLQKGLLVHDGARLRLVSESFRNYLLTGLPPEQALRLEREAAQQARQAGAWAQRTLPLFVLLSAAALFIFFTQRSVLTETQAFLTVITGLAPLLTRFFSLGSFGGTSPAAATATA